MVETPEGSFRVGLRSLGGAMDGDRAFVSLHRGPGGKRRARVEEVTERAVKSIVGEFAQLGPLGAVRPLDRRIRHDFFVLPDDDSAAHAGAADGDIVAARILRYPTQEESGVVTIERRIGGQDAPELGIECVMARFGLAASLPAVVEAGAAELKLDVDAALADPLRRDIRDRFVFTIDPMDARDFDDAVSIERAEAGGWRLGVHIADVSHYVTWGSSVDLEARSRATSVYLADRVLPMLPEALSADLCSLRPDEDRLAMTVDMELDRSGRVRGCKLYPSAIRSRIRLDYGAADAILAGLDAETPHNRTTKTEHETDSVERAALERAIAACDRARALGIDLRAVLQAADDLARARQRIRYARGAIDFETVEVHAVLDDQGVPVDIVDRHRTAATSLIEEAMLLANECVAEYLADRDIEAAYRVHEPPEPDHLVAAARVLFAAGSCTQDEADAIALGDPHAIERALERVHGTPEEAMANALLLRSMQRAVYRSRNEGHFALGAPAYCHFTSPIRRYPDLIVHRCLKFQLAEERLGKRAAAERRAILLGTGREAQDRMLPQLCRHASECERVADAAGHASQKVKVAQYYACRVGERFAATVSWIDEMGVFARLDDTAAEGLLRLRDLGDEWWDFDERTLTLTGEATGHTVRPGTRMIVEVARTDVLRGHLDLRLVTLRS